MESIFFQSLTVHDRYFLAHPKHFFITFWVRNFSSVLLPYDQLPEAFSVLLRCSLQHRNKSLQRSMLVFLGFIMLFLIRILTVLGIFFCLHPHFPFGNDDPESWNVLKILETLDLPTPTAIAISLTVIEVCSFKIDYFRMLPWSIIHLWISKSNTWYTECKIIITS